MPELMQKVWAKSLLWLGRNAIVGAIEHPPPDHRYAAWVDVRGWALGLDAESPVTIEVCVGERPVQRVTPSTPRPDVAACFPAVRGSERCGFDARIMTGVLAWHGATLLTVRAYSEAPHSGEAVLGSRRVWRRESLVKGPYCHVWDQPGVSGSLAHARISVSGTPDPGEHDRTGDATARDILTLARVTRQDTVLEIGCGTGRIGLKLAPHCAAWIGADVSENMLSHARASMGLWDHVSFVHLNGVDLAGLDDRAIDVVYCSSVFMHLDEWDRYRYVLEARRVLKPGGRIYFDNFNLRSDEGWKVFEALCRLEPGERPPNISRSSTPEELRTYAERAGFAKIHVLTRGPWVTLVAAKP